MIHQSQNPNLKSAAQELRRNMTKEERHLWYDFLKTLPFSAHWQKVIGPYIVDFYLSQANLVIELDGSQHYEPEHQQMDLARDEYLVSLGLTVLRYSNQEIRTNFHGVCQYIWRHLVSAEKPHPSQPPAVPPSPKGEGF